MTIQAVKALEHSSGIHIVK